MLGASKQVSYSGYDKDNLNTEQAMAYNIFAPHLDQANDPNQPDPEQILMNLQGKINILV